MYIYIHILYYIISYIYITFIYTIISTLGDFKHQIWRFPDAFTQIHHLREGPPATIPGKMMMCRNKLSTYFREIEQYNIKIRL